MSGRPVRGRGRRDDSSPIVVFLVAGREGRSYILQCSKGIGANLRQLSFLDVSSLTLGRAGNRAAFFCRYSPIRFTPPSQG
ncbi:hypothetical protein PHAMO_170074 [Magnetospirillum molischianum DSM 120]|uniref:Uncharacterized protein n=1 Tax=Magnetospirillum molischianum DSM 120 TaxID=1150626 RepID=H8FNS7_MAGML|nr:hypothetical protein PHAMO_170074 [Magnetospirillum molischianum DSM 120]